MTRQSPLLAALAIAAVALAGCNKTPATNTAYNNSGASATPGSSVTAPATTGSTDTTTSSSTTTTSTMPPSSTSTQPAGGSASPSDTSAPASSTATIASSSPSGTTNVVTDTVSTGKIKAAFASENGLKDSDISVDTANGVVTLTGTVKSREQIALATSVAQRQQGVTRVDSQITVK